FILMNEATVLYTLYSPKQTHSLFYIGLTLVVVGSWLEWFVIFRRHSRWRRENPGEKSPIFNFIAVSNIFMCRISMFGVAVIMLILFIPLALGFRETIDVLVSCTLFWYFGHPLVYFWLLPAYMAWYTIIPKIIGGKVFSDALARLSF